MPASERIIPSDSALSSFCYNPASVIFGLFDLNVSPWWASAPLQSNNLKATMTWLIRRMLHSRRTVGKPRVRYEDIWDESIRFQSWTLTASDKSGSFGKSKLSSLNGVWVTDDRVAVTGGELFNLKRNFTWFSAAIDGTIQRHLEQQILLRSIRRKSDHDSHCKSGFLDI